MENHQGTESATTSGADRMDESTTSKLLRLQRELAEGQVLLAAAIKTSQPSLPTLVISFFLVAVGGIASGLILARAFGL